MRLKTNAIDRSPSGQKISNKLLEHREPAIAVHQDTIVIDKQPVVWKGTPDVFMNFSPDVRIARLVHVESVICDMLLELHASFWKDFRKDWGTLSNLGKHWVTLDNFG